MKNKIKSEPNNIERLINNFEYIIHFDNNKTKLNKFYQNKIFLKFIYITKLSQNDLEIKYFDYYKFTLIDSSDVNIFEVLY